MTHNPLALLLVPSIVALAAGAARPQPPAQARERHRALRAFERATGRSWRVVWCQATGTPKAVYGPGLRLTERPITDLQTARRLSEKILRQHANLLGLGASRFVPAIEARVGDLWILVFEQRFRGLPVVDGRADVRLHASGVLSLLGSEAVPVPAGLGTMPVLSAEEAELRARERTGITPLPAGPAGLSAGAPRLVIWADTDRATRTPVRLAWEVSLVRRELARAATVWVDARNGSVLEVRDDVHHCGGGGPGGPAATNVRGNVKAWLNPGLHPGDPLKNLPLHNLRVEVVGGGSGFTDANGDFDIPHSSTAPVGVRLRFVGRRISQLTSLQGTTFDRTFTVTPGRKASLQVYSAAAGQFDRAQSTCYYHVNDVNEFTRSVVGNLPQLARIDTIRAFVNRAASCNAFYTNNSITFYHRSTCANTAYSTVVEHEWAHGLDDVLGGISRTHGLSEGNADVVAILRTEQPIVGHDFRGPGTFVRTARNTRRYPPSGGVHQQGEVWMGYCWDVYENMVKNIGRAKTLPRWRRIFLASMVANARSQPDAVREVFLADDDDGNLDNGTPNYDSLAPAAIKRNLPYPKRKNPDAGAYTLFGSGCPGTGTMPGKCVSENEGGININSAGFAGQDYAIEVTAPNALRVEGFELFMASRRAGNITIPAAIRSRDAAGRPSTVLRSGSLTLGSAVGWYGVRFTQPLQVAAGTKFFIGFQNPTPSVTLPIVFLFGGKNSIVWTKGLFGWTRTLFRLPWAWRVRCATGSGAVPRLSASGVPEIGRSFRLELSFAAPNAAATLFVGSSKTSWNGVSLPFDLTPFGARGCAVLASGEVQIGISTNAQGAGAVTLSVPNVPAYVGATLHDQFLVVDPRANQLGISFSNGGTGKVGRPL